MSEEIKKKKVKIDRDADMPVVPERKKNGFYKFVLFFFKGRVNKSTVEYLEPFEPGNIMISNHAQMWAPIYYEIKISHKRFWCTQEVLHYKGCGDYAYKDWWSHMPVIIRPLFWLIAHLFVQPLAPKLFRCADTLPVYRDIRLRDTFNYSLESLEAGYTNIITPETHIPGNNIVNSFLPNFVDIARLYYKKTGKCLKFYPSYLALTLNKIVVGHPIVYNPNNNFKDEKTRIVQELEQAIYDIAISLPEHKVVPYENLTKKQWLTNTQAKALYEAKQKEGENHEEA